MKAAVLGENGVEIRELPKPVPAAARGLVRVRAASLNRADVVSPAAISTAGRRRRAPASGSNAPARSRRSAARYRFKAGDRSWRRRRRLRRIRRRRLPAACHRIPANNMSYEQAACLPVALQTMHNAIVTAGRLKAARRC